MSARLKVALMVTWAVVIVCGRIADLEERVDRLEAEVALAYALLPAPGPSLRP